MTELVVALDLEPKAAIRFINELDDLVNIYKIGTSLIYSGSLGMTLIDILRYRNKKVFLDTKLFDIPHTVEQTVKNICSLGVDFITVHTGELVKSAVKGRGKNKLKILSVPLLTSIPDSYQHSTISRVKADLENGADGVVVSGDHLETIKLNITVPYITAVPGVRSAGQPVNDQKRITTPEEASQGNADYIIMGRQILNATNKREMVQSVLNEMNTHG
jgi:orotidine-5'-phosphate decarboxylase